MLLDLHPGNIFCIIPEDNNETTTLSFIDTGLVVTLLPENRKNFLLLFNSIINNNGREAGQLMIDKSKGKRPIIDKEKFLDSMEKLIDGVHNSGLSLGRIGVSSLLQQVFQLCYTHQVKLESKYAMIAVAIGVVEGVGRQLDPDIDLLREAAPYVLKAYLINNQEHQANDTTV